MPIILHAQLDTTKWHVFSGLDTNNNGPLNCFQVSNVTASGGVMTETVKVVSPDVCTGTTYTNAEISQATYNFTFGYVETRIKFAGGSGPWPAFWLIGAACQPTAGNCPWPSDAGDAAETDIAEILNSNHTTVNQQTHITGGGQQCSATTTDVSANFHTYGLLWTSGSLKWYIDGVQTCSATGASVPAHAQFVLIDLFIGSFGGTVNNATLPQSNSVNYVRVCAGATTPSCTATQAQQTGNFDDEFAGTASGGTYTAATGNAVDVNNCVNGTSCLGGASHTPADGDTINIPAGNWTWTSNGVSVTIPTGLGMTIIGAGTGNSTTSTFGASTSCTATTLTLSPTAASAVAFEARPSFGNSTTRISCMQATFGGTSNLQFLNIEGACTTSGCPSMREDNITFTNWTGHETHGNDNISFGIQAVGGMFGVIDHNTVNGTLVLPGGHFLQLMEVSHAGFLTTLKDFGDNSWALPENYGSLNFIFVENNVFSSAGISENEGNTSGQSSQGGGRVVGRYNQFTQMDHLNFSLGWHGTESNGRPRAGRTFEFYNNTIACAQGLAVNNKNQCPNMVDARDGTGLAWGNTYTFNGQPFSTLGNVLTLSNTRCGGAPSNAWFACDGSQPWDTNDGITYFTGVTIASWSGSCTTAPSTFGNCTITVSGTSPGWSTNQWVGYSIHDTTNSQGVEIMASGANTLTFFNTGGPGQFCEVTGNAGDRCTVNTGDSIQILRSTICIDQGGRGAGANLNGINPAPAIQVNQALSPSYTWMNSYAPGAGQIPGAEVDVGTPTNKIQANRDFYQENINQTAQTSSSAPFTGNPTTGPGTGYGTLLNRPSACTANPLGSGTGVAYWETDHNQLDYCIAANTWSTLTSSPKSYAPAQYPHPLISGSGPPPLTPNVSIAPASGSFGSSTTPIPFTMTSTGTANLIMGTPPATITGTNAGDFSLQNITGQCTNGQSIPAPSTCKEQVGFAPLGVGSRSASLNIIDNVAGSPQVISLTGIGIATASVNPLSLVFGNVIVNQSQNQNILLQSIGNAPLVITSIAMSGANYTQTNNCPASLGAGASCLIQVTFAPAATAGCSTGQCVFSGTLTITDNSSTGTTQNVPASGSGILVPSTSVGVTLQGSVQQ